MTLLERYREHFAYESDSNTKLLTMIESVPDASRTDPRFQRAVMLAAHLIACRENWLDWIVGGSRPHDPWFEPDAALEALRPRFAAMEARWTDYLAALTDDERERVFAFTEGNGETYRWYVEGQLIQLNGHACYHRGQIALLVDQLGGTIVDTDYVDWAWSRDPRFNGS